MDLRLNGQTAVVTGASRGIGLAVTRGLVAEGVHVTAGSLKSSAELDELAGAGLVRVVAADLAGPGGPARLVAAAGDRIDILVNNVGAAPARPGGFGEITDEDWQASLTLNLMVAVRTTRAALPVMLAAGRGAIVNISSVNAFLPDPAVLTTARPRPRWPASPKPCPRRLARMASGSTRSVRARSRPTCGSATTGSQRRSAAPRVPARETFRVRPHTRW